jgi:WD40 repeat protein
MESRWQNYRHILEGHQDWLLAIAFSPDSQILASAGCDSTIKLWDTNTGECLATIQATDNWVMAIAWSPDGHTLVSADGTGILKLWNLATKQCWKTLKTKRLYEGMNLTQVTGLTEAQKATLIALGGFIESSS